jgi:phosphoribosylamine--glycine ligase
MQSAGKHYKIMMFGVGSFTQSMMGTLKDAGAEVYAYLTRDYGHYGPMSEGQTFLKEYYPNPCELLKQEQIDFVIPMDLTWALQPWVEEFFSLNIPILCPTGDGFNIERERDFAYRLCTQYGVPFPPSFVAQNKLEALKILEEHPMPYVLKNPWCRPSSPIKAVGCETIAQTRAWLENIDYKEGVFMQQYMGIQEAGHIAFVSHGEIYSIVTNQEYKRAFNGNLGILAGAPLGGIVEADPGDKYGLAKELIHPLRPWFQQVNFHGPLQVTAFYRDHKWYTVEYNIRLGVLCGPIMFRMFKNPLQVLEQVVHNQPVNLEWHESRKVGCMVTLAGYGYPYTELTPPRFSVQMNEAFDCDVWWNEVDQDNRGNLSTSGHRVADIAAIAPKVEDAIALAYRNIKKISCPGSYYRTDIGQTLWPPVYDD